MEYQWCLRLCGGHTCSSSQLPGLARLYLPLLFAGSTLPQASLVLTNRRSSFSFHANARHAMNLARNRAFGHLAFAASAWELLMANPQTSNRLGLFISTKEHSLLHVVAHTWLLWHSFTERQDLKQQKERNRRPYLYNIRNTFFIALELYSVAAWGSAAWRLMS